MGVRGIALPGNDKLISLTILRHMDADAEERAAYLRRANAVRRGGAEEEAGTDSEDASGAIELGEQRYVEMSAQEQFVLTISENGYGKRSSSFEYRTTGRGGKGIVAMSVNDRNGKLVASFPVEDSDQIMLVTDKGQLIRCPVEGIRIAGRSTQGVIVFDTAEDEHVVSVEQHRRGRRKRQRRLGAGPASILIEIRSLVRIARALLRAIGADQANLPNQHLGSGGAQAGSLEIRPGLLRAIGAMDVQPVALGERLRHAGFDLRGKARENGKRCGHQRSDSYCGKCLDH
jgi:hypothetical protein